MMLKTQLLFAQPPVTLLVLPLSWMHSGWSMAPSIHSSNSEADTDCSWQAVRLEEMSVVRS